MTRLHHAMLHQPIFPIHTFLWIYANDILTFQSLRRFCGRATLFHIVSALSGQHTIFHLHCIGPNRSTPFQTVLLLLSLLAPCSPFVSAGKMFELQDAIGNPLFETISISLVCDDCMKTNRAFANIKQANIEHTHVSNNIRLPVFYRS